MNNEELGVLLNWSLMMLIQDVRTLPAGGAVMCCTEKYNFQPSYTQYTTTFPRKQK